MSSSRLGEPSTARSHSLLNAIISASNCSRPRRCSTRPFSYKRLIGSARITLPRDAETSFILITFVSRAPRWCTRSAACLTTSVAMSPPKLTSTTTSSASKSSWQRTTASPHCAGLPVVVRSASTANRPSLSNAEATIPTSSPPPEGSTPTVTCSIISSSTSLWISQSSLNSAFMGSRIMAPCSSCRPSRVPSDPRPRWVSSRRRLEWPNGAMCVFYSGEEPESLRGPEAEMVIVDEIARMRYQQAVFDTMMLGLRLGDRPRVLIATTPRTTPFMKKLVAMDDVRITTGSTYDNAAHLSANFLKKVRELYEGTRLGRQELQGAMILDPVNALFKDDWLIHDEVAEDLIEQVTVGVDPSGRGDEVGIVASALLQDGRFAVLADRTTTGSPAQWGEAVVRCHDDFDADDVVVEVNFGGDMATEVVKQTAERVHQRGGRDTNMIRVKEVSASRGKAMRAEPISLLYEKGRVLHRRGLDQLEAEMMAFSREWDRAVDGSPNRLDAMIWGITRLSKIITQIPIA